MKLLRVNRIKIVCSKGRIEKGETVVLGDAEYEKIVYMTPDAFEVIDANYSEPVAEEPAAEKPKRKRSKA